MKALISKAFKPPQKFDRERMDRGPLTRPNHCRALFSGGPGEKGESANLAFAVNDGELGADGLPREGVHVVLDLDTVDGDLE
jgi:hypothetical protein